MEKYFELAFILLIKSVYRKTPFNTELDRFYKKIEYFPMNFVKKFIYTKKITIIRKLLEKRRKSC